MPTSICNRCLKPRYWRNTRGSSIAGQMCECGGAIVAAVFDETTQTYAPRSTQSKTTGRKFETCVVCGKRRTIPGGGRRVEVDTSYPVRIGRFGDYRDFLLSVRAGDMVCWHHGVTYPSSVPEDHALPADRLTEIKWETFTERMSHANPE